MLLRAAWLGLVVALAGCGVVVIDAPGETSSTSEGSGGRGTASSTGGGNKSQTSSSSGSHCQPTCGPSSATSCSCTDTGCKDLGDDTSLHVECSPAGEKLECVCSYGTDFSGICFETDPSLLCNFVDGCCAGYFSGK